MLSHFWANVIKDFAAVMHCSSVKTLSLQISLLTLGFVIAFAPSSPAMAPFAQELYAQSPQAQAHYWKICREAASRAEAENRFPAFLLTAIAVTESGRPSPSRPGIADPWPWTVYADGRGYRFDTKQEALNAAQGFIDMGINSIDVGCMQVNLKFHPTAFTSLEEAFDPISNVEYAAKLIATNAAKTGSYQKAAGRYHSRKTTRGLAYSRRVYANLATEKQAVLKRSLATIPL